MECKNPNTHDNHICQLKVRQDFKKPKELARNAGFFCRICEAQSIDKNTLCDPVEFKGKPGILKWK